MDNETWLNEIGDEIIERKTSQGKESLSKLELLTYYLWIADYGMRNAGDLESSFDLDKDFLSDGKRITQLLGLNRTKELFAKEKKEFQNSYLEFFDESCEEIRSLFTEI